MNSIRVEGLRIAFGENVILENVNLDFEKGKIHGISAPNGIGKTVFLKAISGFNRPNKGTILFDSLQLYKDIEYPENIRVVFDNSFFGHKSGFENLKFINSVQERVSDFKIMSIMNMLKLDPHLKTPVKKYSTGMKQKLRIAQSILKTPKILVYDEIFNGLDKESVQIVKKIIMDINKKNDVTIFITSHIQGDLIDLCDYIYTIDGKDLILDESV